MRLGQELRFWLKSSKICLIIFNTNRSGNKVQNNEKYPNSWYSNVLDINELVINAAVWHALNQLKKSIQKV